MRLAMHISDDGEAEIVELQTLSFAPDREAVSIAIATVYYMIRYRDVTVWNKTLIKMFRIHHHQLITASPVINTLFYYLLYIYGNIIIKFSK
jgi:hypothetical protein